MSVRNQIKEYTETCKKRRTQKKTVIGLACMVFVCTVGLLALPAMTMENTAYCGKAEHVHTEECYRQVEVTNNEAATDGAQTDEVPTGETLIDETADGGVSAEQSSDQENIDAGGGQKELVCGLTEHTHSLGCFADKTADVETEAEWTAAFQDAELTGNYGQDVLTVATSQLGYGESENNYIVDEDGITKHGYTRYGAKYGNPYGDWCAMFVSFCLDYANVPTEAFPRDASCPNWISQLEEEGLFAIAGGEGESYEPHPGDVVFFDKDQNGKADHAGLVQTVVQDDETGEITGLTTIEGNLSGRVATASYAVNDPTILGYGVLSGVEAVDPLGARPPETGEGIDWGYNDDGIWWMDVKFTSIAADKIQPDTPYIIAGRNRINVMTSEADGSTKLKTNRPGLKSEYKTYQIWYFESAGNGSYRIYTKEADTNKYLKLDKTALSLVDSPADASTFAPENGDKEKFENCVLLKSNEYYLNVSGDDRDNCNGWAGWNEKDEGSHVQILDVSMNKETAPKCTSDVSTNSVINLFDYWLDEQDAADNVNVTDSNNPLYDSGINKNHVFKFSRGNIEEKINKWTGEGQLPLQGVVANTLSDGYPALSGSKDVNGTDSTESLAYLFNPNYQHEGKESFHNVQGLLSINEEGYFSFDCKEKSAEFDKATKRFNVYDQPTANGNFYPLNKVPAIMTAQRDDVAINHYFGMTITSRFIQQNDGHTDAHKKTDTTFHFAGDDDVWIFIDGVLVGDLGGIHDAASVDINFATGDVEVQLVADENQSIKTTLYECFSKAGKADSQEWTTTADGKMIFENNTTHTLKFYYLERGNYNSNMELKYNLTEVPKTAIYKTDQYGNPVKDATFAVYAANKDYNLLADKGGAAVTLPENYTYADNGDIVNGDTILAKALYKGTTDSNGEMIFVDSDGLPYSIKELEELFGTNFILREIGVPEGYRVVLGDVHLEVWHGAGQRILKCDNTKESGARAAMHLQVKATDELYFYSKYNGQETLQYYDQETGKYKGILFAVVFKYTGTLGEDGKIPPDAIQDRSLWTPVYGNDKKGYHLEEKVTTDESDLSQTIRAAKEAQEYGNNVFGLKETTMQLTIENLPGHITTYYRMLSDSQKGDTRYTVGYYWSAAENLKDVDENNTRRVKTFASEGDANYSGFERTFGADIQVPNLVNRVFVQKMDGDNRINGATFAIYQVEQDEDGTIKYKVGSKCVPLTDKAVVGTDGVIKDGSNTISPMKKDVTKSYPDGVHVGTAEFSNLPEGKYIIKEVKAPPGYSLNTHDVMLLVTEDTIYANAGTEDDGISVGRGPGYVVSPLSQFASDGDIDNSLTWMYAQMKITGVSDKFSDVEAMKDTAKYLAINHSSETVDNEKGAAKTYLVYDPDDANVGFNYIPNTNRYLTMDTQNVYGARRLFTTVGWPYYEMYQDYEYGSKVVEEKNASVNYENWSNYNLTNLFSRSTYIRVTDQQETTLTVKKVDQTSPQTGLAGASFRLYREVQKPIEDDPDGATRTVKEYYSQRNGADGTDKTDGADGTAAGSIWTEDAGQATVLTTQEGSETDGTLAGTLEGSFTGLSDGVYYLEETKAPEGYHKAAPIKFELKGAKLTLDGKTKDPDAAGSLPIDDAGNYTDVYSDGHQVSGTVDGESNFYTYTITVPNSTGFELPITGGMGTEVYLLAGLLIMLFSAAMLYIIKKKDGERQ